MEKREVQTYTLDNGLRVWEQATESPTTIGLLYIHHGALHETPQEEGLAHLLEHVIINGGSPTYNPKEHKCIRRSWGYSNASTNRTRTTIQGGFNPEQAKEFLTLSAGMALSPNLEEEILEEEKGAVLREMGDYEGQTGYHDFQKFWHAMASGSLEATHTVLGSQDIVSQATRKQLQTFHQRGYHPNNMDLILLGQIPSGIHKEIELLFGRAPTGPGTPYEFTGINPPTKRTIIHTHAPEMLNKKNYQNSNAQIQIGFYTPHEEEEPAVALRLAAEMLSKGEDNSLNKRIRQKEKLAYGIGAGYSGTNKHGAFTIRGKVLATQTDKAIGLAFGELHKLGNGEATQRDLEAAKNRATYKLTELRGLGRSFALKDPINAQALWNIERKLEGRPSIEETRKKIQETTLDQVVGAAAEHLSIDQETGNYVQLIRNPLKKD